MRDDVMIAIHQCTTGDPTTSWTEAPSNAEGGTMLPDYDGFGEVRVEMVPKPLWDAYRSASNLAAYLLDEIEGYVS